jgi:hypothetical protein
MDSSGRLRSYPEHLWLVAGSMRRVHVTLHREDGSETEPGELTLECDSDSIERLEPVLTAGHVGFAASATKRCETWVRVGAGEHHLIIPVTVLAAAANRLDKISGDHQLAFVGAAWPTPLVVLAEDRYGNRVTRQRVRFSQVDEASGETEAVFECETNDAGQARWHPLARRPGLTSVRAQVAYRRIDDLGPGVSFVGLVAREREADCASSP